jgi:raffinose/stachyose/melibiose transport system substrate-binding protein
MNLRSFLLLLGILLITVMAFAGGEQEIQKPKELNFTIAWELPKKLIQDFEAETGIKVNMEVVTGYQDYSQARNAKIASGESVDIITTFEDERGKFLEKGYILDLKGEPFLNRLIPAFKTAVAEYAGDMIPGVCFETIMLNVWYNKTKFKELGLSVPENYTEFLTNCDKLVAAGETPLVQGGKDNWPFDQELHLGIASTPMDYPNWKAMLKTGQLKWNEGYLLDRFKRVQDLFLKPKYYVPHLAGVAYDQAFILFAKQEAMMWVMGSWATEVMAGSGITPGFEIGAFGPPNNDPGQPKGVLMGSDSRLYSILKSSKNIEEAKKFFEFMTRKDVAGEFAGINKALSTVSGVESEALPAFKDFITVMETRKGIPFMVYTPNVSKARENNWQALALGQKTYKEVADEWQAAQEKDNKAQ